MKKLIAAGFITGILIVFGTVYLVGKYNDQVKRAEKAELIQFKITDPASSVSKAFAKSEAQKISQDLIWKSSDGVVLGTDQDLALGLKTKERYNTALIILLKEGAKSYMRTCYRTESYGGNWSAGYCIDKLKAAHSK